jgi:Tryptophan-associated transmembrane protein (Trp_oprn_chp)
MTDMVRGRAMTTVRRDLALTVAECALGALLALVALSRTWRVVTAGGPVQLPGHRLTGGAVLPWAPAVALVGLAGAGALLALRGRWRSALGAVLVLAGLSLAIGGSYVAVAGRGSVLWALLCALGGLLIGHAGIRTLLRGAAWPALGTRYERAVEPVEYVERGGPSRSDVAMWDALDRGEDPTRRGE